MASEFGSGIVVCLAKFSEHLCNDLAMRIRQADSESNVSRDLEMWANGASDHFYDLDERAPKPLQELADLALKMGHGFTKTVWTRNDWDRLWTLWMESCIAIDKMLGVEADWGTW